MNGPTQLDPVVRDYCRALAADLSPATFAAAVESFAGLRVVVIGDTIFDRYSYVKVQGLTSKNRIISGRFLSEDTQCGGALAVLRHLRQFVADVRFVSLVGTEPWVEPMLREQLGPAQDLVLREPGFTTVIKQRFVEPLSRGKELSKLFAVNFIDAAPPAPAVRDRLQRKVEAALKDADLVVVADFGHGLMQAGLRELVQESAPFLALNCQTNSNNHGFNIVSRQYQRADAFSLDEQELMLSCGHRHIDFAAELEALRFAFRAGYAWLTRGAVETIGLRQDNSHSLVPPLEVDVVDTIGAGDAFFSVAALAAAKKLPIGLATFLAQLAGAQAVKVVGNAAPVSKPALLKMGAALLDLDRA